MVTSLLDSSTLTVADGTRIWFKDWGSGPPVVFSHGWPLTADAWDAQMLFLAEKGFRTIAHDRRGHGRSSQPSSGNDLDSYADDLAELLEALDVHDATLVGHSTGGGEVTRYIGRHGTSRVAKVVLVSAIPPLMLKTPENPEGLPIDVFDELRERHRADRAQFYRDFAEGPFFGANRPGSTVSRGAKDSFWAQSMMSGALNSYECIRAFSETDLTEDLRRFDVPTLIVHGDDDQVVPIDDSARKAVEIVEGATLKVYPGAPHAIPVVCPDQLNEDVLAFLRS